MLYKFLSLKLIFISFTLFIYICKTYLTIATSMLNYSIIISYKLLLYISVGNLNKNNNIIIINNIDNNIIITIIIIIILLINYIINNNNNN